MFSNCCGSNKKYNKKKTITKDAETQSCNDLLNVIENNIVTTADKGEDPIIVEEKDPVIDQPKVVEEKRDSVISQVKIEISDNEDDEVFCEGVGPPIKLSDNLGTNVNNQRHILLPSWFSLEDDNDIELDGVREPPATPVGKDELALKRSRYFSELFQAAESADKRKVHFDPLGPVVAGTVADPNISCELENIVTRLENVTTRLESIYLPVQELLKLASPSPSPERDIEISAIEDTSLEIADMSVQGYQDIMQGALAQYVAISNQIGGDVATHSAMVQEAFNVQLQSLVTASGLGSPNQDTIKNLILPTGQCIQKIQEFREKNRVSTYFNHLSAISESISALAWVAMSPAPAPYIKEMNDAGQFYTNRVLKDWKEKDKKHVDWVKAWIQTLNELQAFVKQYHTTGLVFGGKGTMTTNGAGVPPPPPPGCPPPPSFCDLSITADTGNDRSALFAQINQGENITRGLKKVTDDMQTHKNPTLRQGPAPFKAPNSSGGLQMKAPVDKPPSFVRDGKKWLIEYQKDNHNLLVEGAEMNNVVYLYKCTNSTIVVKGKINSITLDSCKKTSVVFDSLVSCIEFINCQSMQMQVLAKVPTISIDKTDGCQVYLSQESMDVEIVSSKSSEMNVLVPKPNGDYVEYPIPEQFKTTVVPGKGLSTIIVENKG